jgi:hypothetical protein
MSSLQSFLNEVRTHQKVQQALAAGTIIDGVPTAEHLAAMERMFDHLEHSPSEVAIEAHDAVLKVINRGASMKQRLLAIQKTLSRWQ